MGKIINDDRGGAEMRCSALVLVLIIGVLQGSCYQSTGYCESDAACAPGWACGPEDRCVPRGPVLSRVSPKIGRTNGGMTLTLEGENFPADATVTIDGKAATNVVTRSTTQITATVPAALGRQGLVPVVVASSSGKSPPSSRSDLFSYYSYKLAFAAQGYFDAGIYPYSVALGDLNRDGKQDLAVANEGSGDASVMLGNGDGSFQPAKTFGQGIGRSITILDADGDGNLDLAAVSRMGVSVFLGDGHGNFMNAMNYSTALGPIFVASSDMNADGRQDLVVVNYGANNVSLLLGKIDGTFAAAKNFSVGDAPRSVAIADVDRDGKLDLVVASSGSQTVSVLRGDGLGSFMSLLPPVDAKGNPQSVAIQDMNGDGKPDLIIGNYGSSDIGIRLGNSDGTFQNATAFKAGTYPSAVVPFDINRDGKPDLVVANAGSNDVSVLLGDGKGTFGAATNYRVGVGPYSIAIQDMNGDGRPDICVANAGDTNVSVLLGNGDGTFKIPNIVGNSPWGLASKDLDGDGLPDLVTANFMGNSVSVLKGNRDGSFQMAKTIPGLFNPRALVIMDVNRDTVPDLAVANHTAGTVSVLLGSPGANFSPPLPLKPLMQFRGPIAMASLDVNNDGNEDLAVANIYGTKEDDDGVLLLLSRGDGTFQDPKKIPASAAVAVALSDMDGDGQFDLVVAQLGRQAMPLMPAIPPSVNVLRGNGRGDFTFFTSVVLTGPNGMAIMDLNQDNHPDLVVTNFNGNGDVSVLLGKGDGTINSVKPYSTGVNGMNALPGAVAIGDVNGDGIPDLAVANDANANVSVLLGKGDGTFEPAVNFSVGPNPRSVLIKDFNGDGKPDIAVANSGESSVSVLFNLSQ